VRDIPNASTHRTAARLQRLTLQAALNVDSASRACPEYSQEEREEAEKFHRSPQERKVDQSQSALRGLWAARPRPAIAGLVTGECCSPFSPFSPV